MSGVKIGGNIVLESKRAYKDKEFIKVILGMTFIYDMLKKGEPVKPFLDVETIDALRKRYEGCECELLLSLFIDNYHSASAKHDKGIGENMVSVICDNKTVAIGLELQKYLS